MHSTQNTRKYGQFKTFKEKQSPKKIKTYLNRLKDYKKGMMSVYC